MRTNVDIKRRNVGIPVNKGYNLCGSTDTAYKLLILTIY